MRTHRIGAVLTAFILLLGMTMPAFADTASSYLFGNSGPGAGSQSTPVTIDITYADPLHTTGSLSTGTGFQYFAAADGYACDGSYCYYNQGWWSKQNYDSGMGGFNYQPNSNYIAGHGNGFDFRNFFTFDASQLNATLMSAYGIASAKLVVNLYSSSGGSVEYVLSQPDFSSLTPLAAGQSATDLLNDTTNRYSDPNGDGGMSQLYDALYNPGTSYGSATLNLPASGNLEVTLNSAAITQITQAFNGSGETGTNTNSATSHSLFTMGGAVFDNTHVNPVPEPASMLLVATGLAGLIRRRRK